MSSNQPRDANGRWIAKRPDYTIEVHQGIAAPNPNLTQVKIVAVCSCGGEVFTYVRKDGAELVVPLDNPWLHERTFRSACAVEDWPLYNQGLLIKTAAVDGS